MKKQWSGQKAHHGHRTTIPKLKNLSFLMETSSLGASLGSLVEMKAPAVGTGKEKRTALVSIFGYE